MIVNMNKQNYKKKPFKVSQIVPGVSQIVLGALLIAPMILHTGHNRNNGIAWIMVGIGAILCFVGMMKVLYILANPQSPDPSNGKTTQPRARADQPQRETDAQSEDLLGVRSFRKRTGRITPASDDSRAGGNPIAILGDTLIKLSYGILALTVLGTLYMGFFIPAGGASGVPVALGLLLAGVIYAIGKTCL